MWLPEDTLCVLALQRYEDDRHVCGHPLSETTVDPGRDDPWFARDAVCWACAAKERREKSLSSEGGNSRTPGAFVYVTKQPV